ncbi:adenine phosphoribosyltransferase [Coelomomyces lativittatus]|nr:adenine phosphoribosyltransferase [Coelomomyces lativittatus]KAJ1512309.1 adenine phosphoribosyltransferase [Coelomomyces lativittatus]
MNDHHQQQQHNVVPTHTTDTTTTTSSLANVLTSKLKIYPNFPKPHIEFYDTWSWFQDPSLIHQILLSFHQYLLSNNPPPPSSWNVQVMVGLEARGFVLAPWLASLIQPPCTFVPIRKAKKLPGPVHQVTYSKEYGEDTLEIQVDAILPGQSVIIVDDVLATGGSAKAASELVKKCGGQVIHYLFVMELIKLKGRHILEDAPTHSIVKY